MAKHKWLTIGLNLILALATAPASASESDGFGQIFNAVWGTDSARQNVKNCIFTDGDPNLGMVGGVNSFFCHLEKDLGITTATTGVTKTFGTTAIRAVVQGVAGGAGYGGYDFQGTIWVCTISGTTTCNSATQFNKAIFVQWTYKSDLTVNKGLMLQDGAVLSGASGEPFYILWDLGTLSTARSVTINGANFNASDSGNGSKVSGNSSVSGTKVTAGMVFINPGGSQGLRFAGGFDAATNQAAAILSAPGVSDTNKNDTFTFAAANCFNRTPTSVDWTYTPSSSCNIPSVTMPSKSLSDMNTNWTSGATFWSTVTSGSTWTSMSQNPSAI